MKLHNLGIGIVIASIIFLGIFSYVNDLSTTYNETIDLSSMNKSRARFDEQNNLSIELKQKLNFTMSKSNFFYVPYEMISVAWSSLKIFINTIGGVGAVFTDSFDGLRDLGLPIPDWVEAGIMTIIILLLVFIVIYAFFKWKFES